MQLTWFGHAAFGLQSEARLIADPYRSSIGYAPIAEACEVVTTSHFNPQYHSCLDEIRGPFTLIDGLELARDGQTREVAGFALRAIEVAEDAAGNGPNAMVRIEAGGVSVLHMGDCGHLPTPAQTEACGQVDVLLALAGGAPTLALPDLMRFVDALRPRFVVPMHWGAPPLRTMTLLPITELAQLFPTQRVRHEATPHLDLKALLREAPHDPTLLIVPPAR